MSDIDQVVEKEKVDVVEIDETVVIDGEETETEIPEWMSEEAPVEETKEGDDSVPAAKHASIRERLKKKVSKAEEENLKLKERLAKLESGGGQQQQQTQPLKIERPKRPLEYDFETTEEYRAALDDYDDKKDRYDDQMHRDRNERVSQESSQRRQAEEQSVAFIKAEDLHLDRAAVLCEDNKIDAEKYRAANENFMDAITRNLPEGAKKNGARDVIKRLGPGSEVVAYKFGNNPAYRAKLEKWIQEDPTCLTLMMRLGAEVGKVNNPVSRKSKANPPAANANGGSTATNGGAKFLKDYLSAKKNSSHQAAIDIKEDARKAGVDVSGWYKK